MTHQQHTTFVPGWKQYGAHHSNKPTVLYALRGYCKDISSDNHSSHLRVCVIRVDTTGQQSVCLSSEYCHRDKKQVNGTWQCLNGVE